MVDFRRFIVCAAAIMIASGASAATSPWFGRWKLRLETPDQRPETLIYSDAGRGAMKMMSVEDRSELITNFDGLPARDVGTGDSNENSLAIKATSSTSYTWTFLRKGTPRAQGVNTLSKDGRTFTEVSWANGHPEATRTFIYERQ